MQKHINELLQKEMSRKEFLGTVGFGIASVFGLGTVLKLMGHKGSSSFGYGSSSYGGNSSSLNKR
ncbi:MAG: hypothetical protein JWL89_172 [Candidatus Saccharibacteria bacterium]|jgi:hypothetical protein|nr:hypothetical protein [Candidatus Saccharibacteria bacterium]